MPSVADLRRTGSRAVLAIGALISGAAARAVADSLPLQAPARVWVNTRSGVYHCPGTRYYGATAAGSYLAEPEARARGYRPAGGRVCGPLPPTDAIAPAPPSEARGPIASPGVLGDSAPRSPRGPTAECALTRIRDADTIECRDQGQVRLTGIDAPEGEQEPFATAATAGLAALVPAGAELRLESDAEARDRFGRLLAYVWLGEVMVNWVLVRQGWAVAYRYPPNLRYAEWFAAAEQRAGAERRGLWRVDGFACRPADHRAGRC
jgi:micrococcal nuclease